MRTLEQVSAALAGHYRVERQLGAGGMATVYLAHDLKHDRAVAVKLLNDELSATIGEARFVREVRVAAQLTHPHIVPLHDSGFVDGTLYYIMPYIEGMSLRDHLTNERQLAIPEALRLAAEVGDALAYAHRRGVVHRDIKPENILLTEGHALVADFGIARALDAEGEQLTGTGISIGTPAYMSPEQGSGDRVDGRSDIYSLGCVLYEMLAGHPPFTGATGAAVIARHMADVVPPIRTVRPSVSAAVASVIDRALAKTPVDRFPSAHDFVVALRRGSAPASAVPATPARSRRTFIVRAVGAPLAFLAIVLMVVAFVRRERANSRSGSTDPVSSVVLDRRRVSLLPLTVSDTGTAYLADGILNEVTAALSRTSDLSVIALSSVAKTQREQSTIAAIGRALRSGSVIEGSLARHRDSLLVRVRLVDANDETSRWAQDFSAPVSAVRDLSTRISAQLARALASRLVDGQSAVAATVSTPARDSAYDAYLRAKFFDNPSKLGNRYQVQEDSALYYYERAIALDPRFPLPYVGMASVYHNRFFNFDASPRWEKLSFENIGKALRLDPNLAEAYQQRGNLLWTLSNGFPHVAASKLFHRALALKRSYADPHFSLGAIYMHAGLFDRALAQFDTGQDLDPENAFGAPRIARIHYYQGKREQAIREFAPYPAFMPERAIALALLGRQGEALPLLDAARADTSRVARADRMSAKAVVLASMHRDAEARTLIAEAQRTGDGLSHFHHAAYAIAQAYALMGDHPHSLEWLDRVANEGMPCYPLFRDDPALASLRGDARFTRWLEGRRNQWAEFKKTL